MMRNLICLILIGIMMICIDPKFRGKGFAKKIIEIHFKDNYDEQIFKELMTNLFKVKPIEFFSNDKEFADKSTIGFAEIAKIFMFDETAFSFVLL